MGNDLKNLDPHPLLLIRAIVVVVPRPSHSRKHLLGGMVGPDRPETLTVYIRLRLYWSHHSHCTTNICGFEWSQIV